MKRIITALILIPIVLLLVFLGPKWQFLFTILVALVAALAAWEYLRLVEKSGANPPRIVVLAAVLALFAGFLDLTTSLGVIGVFLAAFGLAK